MDQVVKSKVSSLNSSGVLDEQEYNLSSSAKDWVSLKAQAIPSLPFIEKFWTIRFLHEPQKTKD